MLVTWTGIISELSVQLTIYHSLGHLGRQYFLTFNNIKIFFNQGGRYIDGKLKLYLNDCANDAPLRAS